MCIAAVLGGIAVGATVYSAQQAENAEDAQYEGAQEQKKAMRSQQAQNEAQAAQERRKQIREERVKRARILAASSSTGTSGSSGEVGSLGSLSTQLSSNIGFNKGAINTAKDISIFNQASADFASEANKLGAESQMWAQVGSLAMSGASLFGGKPK